jgi:hypothetical protein
VKLSGILGAAILSIGMLGLGSVAQAETQDFTYTSTSGPPTEATGQITFSVVPGGVYEISKITGNVDGQVIDMLLGMAGSAKTSADGLFIYDDDVYATGPALSNPGVLFSDKNGAEYNLFSTASTGPDNFTLYQAVNGAYTENSIGNFALSAPEPATWLMMVFGVAAIGGGLRLGRGTRPVLAAG